MIKIEFENVEEIKEFIEGFRVVETSNNDIVCFGEVESLDSCTEENAKHALDIIKKHKHSDRKEKAYKLYKKYSYLGLENSNIEKAYENFYKEGNEELNSVSKDKDTNESECTCGIDLSSMDSSTVYYPYYDVLKGMEANGEEFGCYVCSRRKENDKKMFAIPFLRYYDISKKIKKSESIIVCEDCLGIISRGIKHRKK